jgi:hypothetical protein
MSASGRVLPGALIQKPDIPPWPWQAPRSGRGDRQNRVGSGPWNVTSSKPPKASGNVPIKRPTPGASFFGPQLAVRVAGPQPSGEIALPAAHEALRA